MKPIHLAVALVLAMHTQNAAADSQQCVENEPLTIISATDDGLYEETHGPENSIDITIPDLRWSNLGQGEPKYLLLDLGALQRVKAVSIAWYKGNERKATYAIASSVDGTQFELVQEAGLSEGKTGL